MSEMRTFPKSGSLIEKVMAKKIEGYIKLQIPAGKANPAPPIGPALGQHGVNIMEFCKAFNAKTQNDDPDMKIPVVITVYADRSFTFETKTPPAGDLLQKGSRDRERLGQAEQGKGRNDLSATRSRDRQKENAGSQHDQPRIRDADDRGNGEVDGFDS